MSIKMRFYLGIFLLFIAACGQAPTNLKPNTKPYFDLKGYFEAEVQRLEPRGKYLKTVSAGGNKEERTVDNIDLKRELSLFSVADINRPAWSDKYAVDSIFDDQKKLVQIQIKTTDDKLKTRKIVIDFKGTLVSKVLIENKTSSSIATSSQVLTYEPSIGYSIENHQKVAMTNDQLFKVVVQFL